MPSDTFFGFSVLIAGRPVPEFVKDGRVYVESNLYTPFSYSQKTEQLVNGELEIESTPVTPYQLLIRLAPHCEDSAIFVYVDGVLAVKFMLEKGKYKTIRGFGDKEGIREFLFALPRFSVDKNDRINSKRESHIGTIEVVRCEASYVKQEYRPSHDTAFRQASKRDAHRVTAGKYTMSTTKKGKLIHQVRPYDVQLKKLWRIGQECGRLTVHYRMGHTLEEMGIELRPIDWSRVVGRKSSQESSPTSSAQNSPTDSPPIPSPTHTPHIVSPVTPVQVRLHSTESSPTSSEASSHPSPPASPPSIIPLFPVHIIRPQTLILTRKDAGIQIVSGLSGLTLPVKMEPEDLDIKPTLHAQN